MADFKKPGNEVYFCTCKNILIPKHQLSSHLLTNSIHKISKITEDQSEQTKGFKASIYLKIKSLLKIRQEIAQCSLILIKNITQNTNTLAEKIDCLINFLKNLITNPVEDSKTELENMRIINTFTIKSSLVSGLNDFFSQDIIAKTIDLEIKKKYIKERVLKVHKVEHTEFNCMAVFNNKKYFATGAISGDILIWNIKNQAQEYSLLKHEEAVNSLSFGNDDKFLLSGSNDFTVRLWNLTTRRQACILKGHLNTVNSVSISKDNKLGVSGGNDKLIKVWDLQKKTLLFEIPTLLEIYQLLLIQNQTIILELSFNINFWKNTKLIKSITSSDYDCNITSSDYNCKSFSLLSNESLIAIGGYKGSVDIFETSQFNIIYNYKPHDNSVQKLDFNDNLKFLISGCEEKIVIWSYENRCLIYTIKSGNIKSFFSLETTYNQIIYLNSNFIFYFNTDKLENENVIYAYDVKYPQVTISSDLKYFVYYNDKICIFDIEKDRTNSIEYEEINCLSLSISSNSKYLACGYMSGNILIISLDQKEILDILKYSKSPIKSLAISSDFRCIGYVSDQNEIKIKDIQNTKELFTDSQEKIHYLMFCSPRQVFIYTLNFLKVQVVNKHYQKVAVIEFDQSIRSILICEENNMIIIKDIKNTYSCLNLQTLKKDFQKKSKSGFIKWCIIKNDFKGQVFKSLRRVNF